MEALTMENPIVMTSEVPIVVTPEPADREKSIDPWSYPQDWLLQDQFGDQLEFGEGQTWEQTLEEKETVPAVSNESCLLDPNKSDGPTMKSKDGEPTYKDRGARANSLSPLLMLG